MILRGFYLLLALASCLNGIAMLVAPYDWFYHGPAGVTDSGVFNPHFVRDVGIAFTLMAAASFWCAWRVKSCEVVHYGLTWFFLGHGILHCADILMGRFPPSHWTLDFVGVFLPAILLVLLCIPGLRKKLLPSSNV